MKHIANRLSALAVAGVLSLGLSAGASAAPDGIAVQLDGKALSFTDAVPQVREGRTFLPFRAVFEAMGAEVSYSPSANTVTAKRDGVSVTMALGSTTAVVERDGLSSQVTMDVAPFAENDRTYVPVRFAAQALGCAVGWDQDDQTVILVDAQRQAGELLKDYQFTYLDKFVDYAQQYRKGGWAVKGEFDASVAVAALPITIQGTLDGLMKDGAQMQMDMNMKADMLQFTKTVAAMNQRALTAEDEAVLTAFKETGLDMAMRGDMELGKLYMNMNDKTGFLAASGIHDDMWYSMDLGAALAESGMGFQDLMDMFYDVDIRGSVLYAAANVALTDKDTAMADFAARVREVAYPMSDGAFVKNGNDYTTQLADVSDSGADAACQLTLTMKNDKVAAWKMTMDLTAVTDNGDGTQSTTAMDLYMGVDEQDHCSAQINVNVAEMLTLDLGMEVDYTASTKAPDTQPPAGAVVQPLESMTARTLADPSCPTCPVA